LCRTQGPDNSKFVGGYSLILADIPAHHLNASATKPVIEEGARSGQGNLAYDYGYFQIGVGAPRQRTARCAKLTLVGSCSMVKS
jgi:hypothetical protein